MSAYGEFQQWLVIDWAGTGGAAWMRPGEKAERFLLVTPTMRKWEPDASSLSVQTNEYVLVMLLTGDNPLDERTFNADNFLRPAAEPLPIWCHYGGGISLRELEDEWLRVSLLDEALRDKLTKRLPPPNPYPMPFSNQLDFAWQSEWKEIKNAIRSYESKEWDRLKANLNDAWAKATKELGDNAVKVTLAAWLGARNAFERLFWLLPQDEQQTTKEQLASFLLEATALRIRRLSPYGSEAGPSSRKHREGPRSEMESSLSAAFEEVLNTIASIMVRKNTNLDRMRNDVKSVRAALLKFRQAYDEKVKCIKRSS